MHNGGNYVRLHAHARLLTYTKSLLRGGSVELDFLRRLALATPDVESEPSCSSNAPNCVLNSEGMLSWGADQLPCTFNQVSTHGGWVHASSDFPGNSVAVQMEETLRCQEAGAHLEKPLGLGLRTAVLLCGDLSLGMQ
jgi:hypothetical protein